MLDLIPLAKLGARGWARALLILGASTMMAAWLSIWVALLTAAIGSSLLLPGPVQEAVVLVAAVFAWRLLTSELAERMVRALFSIGALAAAASAIAVRFLHGSFPFLLQVPAQAVEPGVATALVVATLWWTGGRIGASALDDYAVFRFFAFGLAGLFSGLIMGALAGAHSLPTGMLDTAAAVFFIAAFLTLLAAQLARVRARGNAHGARVPPRDWRWAGIAGGATLGIVILALILSATLSGSLLRSAMALLADLRDLLIVLLSPFILAIGYLAQALIDLVRHFMGQPHAVVSSAPPPARLSPFQHVQHQGHASSLVQAILGSLVACVVAVLVLMLLGRAIGRLGERLHDEAYEEERDSVWSWEEASAGWQAVLARLRGRLHRMRPAGDATGGPPRSVRDAYRRMLRLTAALGHAREAPETPQEYLGRLHRVPIPHERDATVLTAAYMRVRYGEECEQPEDVEQVVRAWERLDQGLRLPPASGPGGNDRS